MIISLASIGIPFSREKQWIQPLNAACSRYNIDTVERQAHFFAQIAWESSMFAVLSENLNYDAKGLMDTFKDKFTVKTALQYSHQPDKIANHVYANIIGNGDETSGDGWKYRGRGLIQITGRDNYRACSAGLGLDLENDPDLLLIQENAAMSAGWYWYKHNCNTLADHNDITAITKAINGGTNGLDHRLALYNHIKENL